MHKDFQIGIEIGGYFNARNFSLYADFLRFYSICDITFWTTLVNTIVNVWIIKNDHDRHMHRIFFVLIYKGHNAYLFFNKEYSWYCLEMLTLYLVHPVLTKCLISFLKVCVFQSSSLSIIFVKGYSFLRGDNRKSSV